MSTHSPDVGAVAYRTVHSAEQFASVAVAWDALFARAACAAASLTSAAVHAYLAHRVRPDERPVVVLAEVGGTLIGALPLVGRQGRGGLSLSTFGDLQTYGVDFLVDPAYQESLRRDLLAFLFRQYPGVFSVRLMDVRADSASVERGRNVPSVLCHTDVNRQASYLEVPGTPADIPSSLSQNFRKNLRKQEARLRTLPDVQFAFVGGHEVTDAHFDAFIALEKSGWKGENGTAIGCRAELHAYYRDLTTLLANAGQLEWHLLSADGRLIGAHLAVRSGRVLNLLKIAYDEGYAHSGPGNMLFLEMLRREAADGRSREVDCLTDMPWHRNWRMESRPYLTVTLFRRGVVPVLFGYLPVMAADALRRSPAIRAIVRGVRKMREPRHATGGP